VIAFVFIGSAFVTLWLFLVIVDIWSSRPTVTKDPHTGKLHIPRSDLEVGEGRSHRS
jgi:hypothetical protein